MQVTKKNVSDTKVQLTLAADAEIMKAAKEEALRAFAREVKVQGFRQGKAPLHLVEKQLEPARLQADFIERALNRMYGRALEEQKLRPIAQPEIKIGKFVPYEALEAEATVEVVGEVTLPDYKKIKLTKDKPAVTAKEVDEVLKQLKTREAEKKDVDRTAKQGDQVWIDFKGVDAKTKEPIKGAEGKQHPLNLGSNTFIPGFEENLVGLKAGEQKQFDLTFPKDYGVKSLQNRKVTFDVTVTKVQEVIEPELDDTFAAKVGPFKTVDELKADIKKELQARKEAEANQKYADDLVKKITEKTKVAIPQTLIDEQLERLEQEHRQDLTYSGLTWQEFLEREGLTPETYREKQRPMAELRVKAGLVLSEIAEAEGLEVTKEELDAQLNSLKQQYPDPQMRQELEKPEARRSIASRLLTEKTIAKLTSYAA
jgi:trigger factor